MELSHKFDKEWHLIPIIGSDLHPENDLNIGSLRHTNPVVRSISQAGLVNIVQLFNTTDLGHIDTNSVKSRVQLQAEFDVDITLLLMNSIACLIRAAVRLTQGQTSLKE